MKIFIFTAVIAKKISGKSWIVCTIYQTISYQTASSPQPDPFVLLPLSPTQAVADRLIALAQSLLDEQGIAWQDTLYVGVACPGQIDR